MLTYVKVLALCIAVLMFSMQCEIEQQGGENPQVSREEAVENGLLPAVIIKGESPETMNIIDQMKDHCIPGVCITVINDGKIEWTRGYGVTHLGGEAVDGNTLFRATQMTQLVVAMAILRMVEEGDLNLDKDINEQLISWQFPANDSTRDEKVTIRRILSHTAGIPYTHFNYYSPADEIPTLFDVLDGREPATNEAINVVSVPGSRELNTKGGYAVLQLLIEETTSKSFQKIMRDLVLGPAKMDRSFFAQRLPQDTENAALGYDDAGEQKDIIHPELSSIGLWTTADDFARLIIEIQNSFTGGSNHILSQEMTRLMLTPVLGTWGLGPKVHGEGDTFYFAIEGHGSCYLCYAVGFPALGKGAVILTNASAGEIITSQVLRSIAHEYDWPAFRPREVEPVYLSKEIVAEIAGVYSREEGSNSYELRPIENELYLLRKNRKPKRLIALSGDVLVESDFGIEYHIERNEEGKITGIVRNVSGRRGLTMLKRH